MVEISNLISALCRKQKTIRLWRTCWSEKQLAKPRRAAAAGRQASLTSKVKPLFRRHQRKNTTTARSSPQKTHAHTKTRRQLKPCTCTAHTSCGAFRTRRRRRKKGVTPASIVTQCRQTQFKWTNEKRWSLLRKTKRDGAAGDMLMQLA